MDQNNQVIHTRLDAFELRVLERLAPTFELSTFQVELSNHRADLDSLLVSLEFVPETAPTKEVDIVVISALFGDSMLPPNSFCVVEKRYGCTFNNVEAQRLRKKDW